jgi:L-ascorbate metabolism protein UlaG (beta-lactamase superfamily)
MPAPESEIKVENPRSAPGGRPLRRRSFLKYSLGGVGAAMGAGSWWLAVSKRRGARWFRQMLADSRRQIAPAPARPTPAQWSDQAITLSWLGHATVLINFHGIRILTDPAFGARVGISLGLGVAGPKRFIAPALRMTELPPIDVVLLSHAHMDHMDLPSLRRFPGNTAIVTATKTSDILAGTGLTRITEMRWNDRVKFENKNGALEIEALQVKHWGQRWPSELERGYNGYVLRREGKSLLFAGDTAHTPLFAGHRSRGPFEAAIMPVGAYQPWIRNHCTPEQAVEMANQAGARYIIPIHHQTFRLSDEPINEPIERITEALAREPERLALRRVGDTFVCPRA